MLPKQSIFIRNGRTYELLGKENEGPLGPSQPIIRELITFPTVAAKLAATVNPKVLIVLALNYVAIA